MTDYPEDGKPRENIGFSLRRCSHNRPFEDRCPDCVEEALQRESDRNSFEQVPT